MIISQKYAPKSKLVFYLITVSTIIASTSTGYSADNIRSALKKSDTNNLSQKLAPSLSSTSDDDSNLNYLFARNIRAEQGHVSAVPLYRTLLQENKNDFTASSRIAAAHSSPSRHDSIFQNDADEDIYAFRQLLTDCDFTNENVKQIFGIQGDKAFASGPVYLKPVMAGSAMGLPPRFLPLGDENDDGSEQGDRALRCLISMFLLGYSGKHFFSSCNSSYPILSILTEGAGVTSDSFFLPIHFHTTLFCYFNLVPESILAKILPNPSHNIPLLKRLNLIFPCELDPDLLVPYVQLFPLDIEINTPPPSSTSSPSSSSVHQNKNEQNIHTNTEQSLIFVTDWHPNVLSTISVGEKEDGAIMYIGPDSLALVQHLPQPLILFSQSQSQTDTMHKEQDVNTNESKTTQILDFCSGSGVQAIATLKMLMNINKNLKKETLRATCYDINERALRFIRFNALLNGFSREEVTATKTDLRNDDQRNEIMQQWEGSAEIILANPPFIPVPPPTLTNPSTDEPIANDTIDSASDSILKRYGLFSSGGPDGEDVLREIISLAPLLLNTKTGGFLAIVSEFMNPSKSVEIVDRMKGWWFEHDRSMSPIFSCSSSTIITSLATATRGILFTNEFPVSADTYASRRANDEDEYHIWCNHLKNLEFETISPGLLFMFTKLQTQGQKFWNIKHSLIPKSDLGSVWTPHNRKSVEVTSREWSEEMYEFVKNEKP